MKENSINEQEKKKKKGEYCQPAQQKSQVVVCKTSEQFPLSIAKRGVQVDQNTKNQKPTRSSFEDAA